MRRFSYWDYLLSQNVSNLTGQKALAARLVAEDELTDEKIAAQVGVSRKTIARWRELPDFQKVVREHETAINDEMLRLTIAKRHKRVAQLDQLMTKMLTVIEERSEDPNTLNASGGATGLIVRDIKVVGVGPSAQLVDVYGVDTALLREFRATHEQAARELGQWSDKTEQTMNLTGSVELVGVSAEDI
jgi:Homeodomain-like domain